MDVYIAIIQNKELIKIFYGLIITLICATIVIKSDRIFRLSNHNGIRYFRNAFFFYGIAFALRYLSRLAPSTYTTPLYNTSMKFIFEYFLIMAGFFLLYSLLWKKIETTETQYFTSLFNSKILIFYAMAFIIVLLDYIWKTYYFMFSSQIILFLIACAISYNNYRKKPNKIFPKFYFLAMLLSLIAWVLNAIAELLLWNRGVLINVYILNTIIFLLFLFGVIKVTR